MLNIWARFIYGPLLDDRVRSIAEGTTPGEYGRREAFTVHTALKEKGPVRVPREFVFMDRAAIGLGGVFLHLDARLNYFRIFNDTIEGFDLDRRRRTPAQDLRRSGRAAAGRVAAAYARSIAPSARRLCAAMSLLPVLYGEKVRMRGGGILQT